MLKEKLISTLLKVFQKTEEGTFSNSFDDLSTTLTPKSDKDTTRKETHTQISLMNMDTQIFNKILASQIEQKSKNITLHDQVEFIPDMQR